MSGEGSAGKALLHPQPDRDGGDGVRRRALLLILPLLWAPVLAVAVSAAMAGASVDYSTAYAEFRIVVSRLIYPLAAMPGEDPLIGLIWQGFQVIASVVGGRGLDRPGAEVVRPYLRR